MLSVQAPTKDFQELNASRLIAWQDFHCTTKNNKFPRTHFLGESYQPSLSVGNYLSFCWILQHGDQRFMLNGTLLLTTGAISLAELERLTVTISPVGLETQNSILRKKH